MSRSIVSHLLVALPLAMGFSSVALADNATGKALETVETAEWAQVRVDAAEGEVTDLESVTYYRWLCQAKSRSRSLVFSHSANNIGQAQFRALGECRSRMDSYGYYPGYCQLLRCSDRWNVN